MTEIRFSCPSCSAEYRITKLHLAGKTIKCPKCSGAVKVPPLDEPELEPVEEVIDEEAAPATKRPKRPRHDDDFDSDDYDERPKKRRKKRQPKKSGLPVAVLAVVGCALLGFCLIGAVGGFLLFRNQFTRTAYLPKDIAPPPKGGPVGVGGGNGDIGADGIVPKKPDKKPKSGPSSWRDLTKIYAWCYDANGSAIAVQGQFKSSTSIFLFDGKSGAFVQQINSSQSFRKMALSADGSTLALFSSDGGGYPYLSIWDAKTGRQTKQIQLMQPLNYTTSTFKIGSLRRGVLWFAGPDRLVGFVDGYSPDRFFTYDLKNDRISLVAGNIGQTSESGHPAIHPSLKLIAFAHARQGSVAEALTVIDLATKRTRKITNLPSDNRFLQSADVAFSRDGKLFAVAFKNGLIEIFDSSSWAVAATLKTKKQYRRVFLVNDGKTLVGATDLSGSDTKESLDIWDIKSQKVLSLPLDTTFVSSAALAADGRTLTLIYNNSAHHYDVINGKKTS